MMTRNFIAYLALAAAILPQPAAAQDANVVSDWLMQNKPWQVCPPERLPLPGGRFRTNPDAFIIDPATRTSSTGCVQSGPYRSRSGNVGASVDWYLQSITNLDAPCLLKANEGSRCVVDAVRVCSKIAVPQAPGPCKSTTGKHKCGACLSAETRKTP